MREKPLRGLAIAVLLITACVLPTLPGTPTPAVPVDAATQTAAAALSPTPFVPTPTTTLPPQPVPSEGTPATPASTPVSGAGQQFIAYIRDGQLLVTDVSNGVQGGTTQYTVPGELGPVEDLAWSPSGELIAFTASMGSESHLFYIFALGQSSPMDLGVGSAPAWSSDSQSLAYIGGGFENQNIWITPVENPAPRQLTFETNYAWGRPVFTPDGESLIVAGTNRDNMGASGNTNFTLDYLELDGSGTRTPIPGTLYEGGRLPYDMQFSPDGTKLAFSTSFHWNACASPGAYYVLDPASPGLQELVSPALHGAIDDQNERFHVGLSYDWMQSSNALVAQGNVVDCKLDSPTVGQIVAGPQMSVLGLDGSEPLIISGFFSSPTVDRSGTWIAAAYHAGGFQDLSPLIQIYSAGDGQRLLDLGPGMSPKFQP